jgi:hypothetical protein
MNIKYFDKEIYSIKWVSFRWTFMKIKYFDKEIYSIKWVSFRLMIMNFGDGIVGY